MEFLDCLGPRGSARWEDDLLDAGKSVEIKRRHTILQITAQDGSGLGLAQSLAPAGPLSLLPLFFNWPGREKARAGCEEAGRTEGRSRSPENSGWCLLHREEIEGVSFGGGSVER